METLGVLFLVGLFLLQLLVLMVANKYRNEAKNIRDDIEQFRKSLIRLVARNKDEW